MKQFFNHTQNVAFKVFLFLAFFLAWEAKAQNYCTTNLYTNGCSANDRIDLFTFGNINNPTSTCSADGYSDYTNLTAYVNKNGSYTVSMQANAASAQGFAVWIDYNQDKDFDDAEVGFTLCEALVARNGSILLSNANAAGRRLSIYPPVHIVLAYSSQLVLDLKDGFNLINMKYGNKVPSMISNVTPPRRTADIDKTLVLGAHGPKEFFVFLLDG